MELPKEPFELTITGLSSHAEGIGRYDGKVIFVEGALPQEKCKIRAVHNGRKMARAVVTEILEPSPYRIIPPCPYYTDCGGCQFQHYTYEKQLEYKQQTVQDALRHIGNLDIQPNPVIGGEPFAYRNKMTFPLTVHENKIVASLHPRNSYKNLTPLGNCMLLEKPLQEMLVSAIEMLNEIFTPNDVYNFDVQTGNLRYLSLRSFTGKNILILVKREYQKEKIRQLDKFWSTISGWTTTVVYESPDINEYDWGTRPPKYISGQTTFEIPFKNIIGHAQPTTFLQTNSRMAEKLYEHILSLPILENEVLLDGYCGIGLLSLGLANRFQHVIGIDTDNNAISSARSSAQELGITNVQFLAAPVEHALRIFGNPLVTNPKPLRPSVENLASDALEKLGNRKITAVILDPPRAGCHPKVIKRLGEIQPKDIILVSCHPATLARDLSGLISLGYKPFSVQPFDLFPQTFHVETVVHVRKG
jgi:23S rRNA (uracil1939-C5)-methyltransferase